MARYVRPRVLIDADEVLYDFFGGFLTIFNEIHGTNRRREEITTWEIGHALGISPEVKEAVFHRLAEAGGCLRLGLLPGAKEGIERIKTIANVYIVTAPFDAGDVWAGERRRAIKRDFDLDRDNVVSTHAKETVGGDMIVDDKVETLHKWQEHYPYGMAVCWEGHHNASSAWNMRARNWDEVFGMVQALAHIRDAYGFAEHPRGVWRPLGR